MAQPIVHCHPEIQGGVPVFYGTRVPVKNLFDYLEAGDSLGRFLVKSGRWRRAHMSGLGHNTTVELTRARTAHAAHRAR